MGKTIKNIILVIGSPLTFLSTLWLKIVFRIGPGEISKYFFMKLGILPIKDNFYQPMINPKKHLMKSLRSDRELPGIDFNIEEQIELVRKFDYNEELLKFPTEKKNNLEFYYNNVSYCSWRCRISL